MEALPTLARLATASTLKPAQPVSPKRVIAASATRRSTSGSRGRPACAGLVVTLATSLPLPGPDLPITLRVRGEEGKGSVCRLMVRVPCGVHDPVRDAGPCTDPFFIRRPRAHRTRTVMG